MIRHQIEKLIAEAIRAAQEAGEIPAAGAPEPLVERPQRPEHGDYASSLPLRLARTAGINPLDLARVIAGRVPSGGAVESVDNAPSGFINIRLSTKWLASEVGGNVWLGKAVGGRPLGGGEAP